MRRNIVGLLTVALMCVCGVAAATPIVYNVNIAGVGESVSGTITTDGVIGALTMSDITAWDLTASGSIAFITRSTDVEAGFSCKSQCGLIASTSSLSFDFSIPLHAGFDFLLLTIAGTYGIDCTTADVPGVTTPGRCVAFFKPDPFHVQTALLIPEPTPPSLVSIASASALVPEPGTLTLLGLALACLGFSRKRFRGRQPAVV